MSMNPGRTYQQAVELIGATSSTDATQAYSLAGALPADIANHTVEREYIICGVTPGDYVTHHGSTKFELAQLQADFKTICTDYIEPLEEGTRSYAAEFCSKVIYEIGPESRKGDKTSDKVWKMRFMYKSSSGSLDVRTLFIDTYRNASYGANFMAGKSMCVTVKQAGLLAMDVFDRPAEYAIGLPESLILLTPLAGSIFSRDDIAKIATEIGTTPLSVLSAINNSCQSGGQYLERSSINIAIVASMIATRNIREKDVSASIIGKTIRQYLSMDKQFNETKFEVYCAFAHGGVPQEMAVDTLLNKFAKMQDPTTRALIRNAPHTMTRASVNAPSNGHQPDL